MCIYIYIYICIHIILYHITLHYIIVLHIRIYIYIYIYYTHLLLLVPIISGPAASCVKRGADASRAKELSLSSTHYVLTYVIIV